MKMITKVLLTAAALVVLAVPAMAVDKLIVKNSAGTADVFKVDDTGTATAATVITPKLGLGTSTPLTPFHNADSATIAARGGTFAQHNEGGHGASIVFKKSRGTEALPAPPSTANDYIGLFQAQYFNGNTPTTPGATYDRSAQFGFRNDGVASYAGPAVAGTTVVPTAIMFFTGASTQSGDPLFLSERLRISSKGSVVAGNMGGTATSTVLTTATDGHFYVPTVAGAVTSCATMTTYTGHAPIWVDTTNLKVCSCIAGALKCTAAMN